MNNSTKKWTQRKPLSKDMRTIRLREKKIPLKNLILDFLEDNPQSTLTETTTYLEFLGYSPSRPTVNTILKDLEKKKIIKNVSRANQHPCYEIIDSSIFKIQNDSYVFKDQICCNNLSMRTNAKERSMIREHNDSRKDTMVDMILRLGLISYYTCLSSFEKSISPKAKVKENEIMQEIWLRNAMSLENNLNDGKPSTYLKLQIESNIGTDERIAWENSDSDEDEKMLTGKHSMIENIEEAKKLKKLFSKMFPEWYESFQGDEKVTEKMKDRLRDVCINHPEYLL